MTTEPTRCSRSYSPRTAKRIQEKQRRREMVINEDIVDKLHHADFNFDVNQLSKYKNVDRSSTSSPEKSASKQKQGLEDGLNKMRIEKIMGSYDDFKQLENLGGMPGISGSAAISAPSSTSTPCKSNTKRRMPGHRPSSHGNRTASQEKAACEKSGARAPESATAVTAAESKQRCPKSDLRDRINRKRSSTSCSGSGKLVTHKSLKDRNSSESSNNLLEFTKLPDRTVKGGEDESKHRKQEKRTLPPSSSSELRKESDPRRESDRSASGERKPSGKAPGDRKRSNKHRRRQSDELDSIKPLHSVMSAGSDCELSADESHRLSTILKVMSVTDSSPLSPLPHKFRPPPPQPLSRLKQQQDDYDSEEEELDLLKFEERLKSEGRLSFSSGGEEPAGTATVTEATTTVTAGDMGEEDGESGSDIDSDQDYDEFPLCKSTVDIKLDESAVVEQPVKQHHRVPEPREVSRVKEEKQESKPVVVKQESKPAVVKREQSPATFSERHHVIKSERQTADRQHVVKSERHSAERPQETAAVKTPEVKMEVKPVVAVNPRVKNLSICEDEGSSRVKEILSKLQDGPSPQLEENLVDIRQLVSQGAQFNLLLSFGFDKISSRSLNHKDILKSVKSFHMKRGEMESEDDTKLVAPEKPSCKVPCIPRADSTHAAPPVARAEPVTRAESHVSRDQHREVKEEERSTASPDRDSSPGYHRDKRDYGYPPKRRRIARDQNEYDQFAPPPPYHHAAFPNGISCHTALIPNFAYLVQQPASIMPHPVRNTTFTSRGQKDSPEVEKALKSLLNFKVYSDKGTTLKREADAVSDQTMKIRKYMEACIQYVYAGLSVLQKPDFQGCYKWLFDTVNILDFCLRPRSTNGLDVRIQDKRLAVLCLMLISHIQWFVWKYRKTEYLHLQKHCSHFVRQKSKSECEKSSSQYNKSVDSPTPSPAGSITSMASYTGTEVLDSSTVPLHSLPPSENVPSKLLRDLSKYFKLSQHLNDWVEYWEEAAVLAQHNLGFFHYLDEQVGPVSSTTHIYTVASYVGQGLQNLDKDFS